MMQRRLGVDGEERERDGVSLASRRHCFVRSMEAVRLKRVMEVTTLHAAACGGADGRSKFLFEALGQRLDAR
jgi:hypothetical protein